MCTSPAWNFSPTRLNDSTSLAFRSSRVYHTSRIPPLTPLSSGVSKTSGQILLPRISFVLRPIKYTIRRYKDALMILTFSRTPSLFEHTNKSMTRETPNSMKLFVIDSLEKKRDSRFCFVVLFEYDDARSRRSEWPTTRTRSRRVADREVDHVIQHRIVPLGAPQETNDEVYRQGPG